MINGRVFWITVDWYPVTLLFIQPSNRSTVSSVVFASSTPCVIWDFQDPFVNADFVQSYKLTSQIFFRVSHCSSFSFTLFCLQHSVLHYHNPWFPSTNHHWLNESIIFAWGCKDATKCNALKGMKLVISHKFSVYTKVYLPTVGSITAFVL